MTNINHSKPQEEDPEPRLGDVGMSTPEAHREISRFPGGSVRACLNHKLDSRQDRQTRIKKWLLDRTDGQ